MGLRYSTRRAAKQLVASALYRTPLLAVARRRRTTAAATVLLYHRIVDRAPEFLDYSPSGMTLRADVFDDQMRYLRAHYDVVPLDTIRQALDADRPLPDRLCAVTFDDGWRDNYTHAFPILQRHGVTATIFLATGFIEGTGWFWEERLKYVLGHICQRHLDGAMAAADASRVRSALDRLVGPGLLDLPVRQLRRQLTEIVRTWRPRPAPARASAMEDLEQLLHLPGLAEPRRFMTWDEVREMGRAGMDFGAHTHSHPNLELCEDGVADEELRQSKAIIERELGRPVSTFAYPYGKHTASVRALAAANGFAGAFTTQSGLLTNSDDRTRLNRIDIHGNVAGNLPLFACRALHLFAYY